MSRAKCKNKVKPNPETLAFIFNLFLSLITPLDYCLFLPYFSATQAVLFPLCFLSLFRSQPWRGKKEGGGGEVTGRKARGKLPSRARDSCHVHDHCC